VLAGLSGLSVGERACREDVDQGIARVGNSEDHRAVGHQRKVSSIQSARSVRIDDDQSRTRQIANRAGGYLRGDILTCAGERKRAKDAPLSPSTSSCELAA